MTDPYDHIPGPVTPGMVLPTNDGKWVFSIMAGVQPVVIANVPYYSAGMAKGAMRDLVAKLNARKPKLQVVS